MAAYSPDLRQKILSAWQNKENTQRDLAKRFKVSTCTELFTHLAKTD